MECRRYDSSYKDIWDMFVRTSRTPLFFFERDFIEYHGDRFEDHSILFFDQGKLVAVLPASKYNDILYSHGGLTYGGLLVSEKLRAEHIQTIMSLLRAEAISAGYKKLIYKAIPYIFHRQPYQEDLYFIQNLLNGSLIRRDLSSAIDLSNRMRPSKGRRWLISRAKNSGLVIEDSDDWESFHGLMTLVLKKHGTSPVHSLSELIRLKALFPERIQLKSIVMNDKLVAATVLFKFEKVVHTQYLAHSEEGKAVGALDLLLEHCIEQSMTEGFDFFNFGISSEQQGKILNMGLISQKESFGGRGVSVDWYEVILND